MPNISLNQLVNHPQSANRMDAERFQKLKRNIELNRQMPALIVKQDPDNSERYTIIDGHYRKKVAEELGMATVPCDIWKMNVRDEKRLLLTLNRLRGEDHPRKRAELIDSLMGSFSAEKLALFLPESTSEIDQLLKTLSLEQDQFIEQVQAQLKQESAKLPTMLNFILSNEDADFVKEVLTTVDADDQNNALLSVCQEYKRLSDKKEAKKMEVTTDD